MLCGLTILYYICVYQSRTYRSMSATHNGVDLIDTGKDAIGSRLSIADECLNDEDVLRSTQPLFG